MATKQYGEHAPRAPRLVRSLWSALVGVLLLPVAVASASSGITSEDAAREILRIQAKADQAAQEWAELESESDELAIRVAEGQAALDRAAAAFAEMSAAMTAIAINRFMGGGVSEVGLLGENPVLQLQKDALADIAIGAGDANLDSFETLQSDLETKQAELSALQQQNADAIARLAAKQASLDDQLVQLAALEERLKDAEVKAAYERLLAERRAAEKADAEEAAARAAAAAARNSNSQTVSTQAPPQGVGSDGAVASATVTPAVPASAPQGPATGSGSGSDGSDADDDSTGADGGPEPPATTDPPRPAPVLVGGSWFCPVAGPNAFGDSYGDPRSGGRSHVGTDMMSPEGTPLVAVVAGFAQMKTNRLGGNAIGLKGVDGHYYYYAHLSAWEGGSRNVGAGEVIGYVGHTGNTTADHLHFEIHPGGGGPINPYHTLREHC